MQAMILAAGLGTRLLPHTTIRPKPLFPILNRPLLLLTVERLQNLGFDHIVVNCHHLRQQMVEALQWVSGVVVQEEETILGTGGGLRRALGLFRDEPLLVTNGDIYHSVDFLDFYRHHAASGRSITLAMHDYPRFNGVLVQNEKIIGFGDRVEPGRLAFTGLHVIDPAILRGIVDGRFSCIIDHYQRLLQQGIEMGCYRSDRCYWTDMGTEEDYLALHGGLLTGTIPCWLELSPASGPCYIASRGQLGAEVDLIDWVCLGNACIGKGSHMERVVVWDGVRIPDNSYLRDRLVSADLQDG
jgi:NDP-sugar pyrophosphorylase family protein